MDVVPKKLKEKSIETQNLNNYYQVPGGINNTNTHSNLSNNNTNNQFNFSKNNINFLNNFNVGGNTNNIDNNNKDKNKREIIEDILRDTSNGSFLANIENERPFTPPFTKLVPTNNLVSLDKDKVNTSSISKENLFIVNAKNIMSAKNKNNNINNNHMNINGSIEINKSMNKNNFENNIDLSKIEDINNYNNGKMNTIGNLNESKIVDRSYMIKDINYMDLVFDHVLGYYFDPKTNVYYELKTNNNNIINQE